MAIPSTAQRSEGLARTPEGALYVEFASGDIPGTTTNDNAAAGRVGEYVEAIVTSASPVALVTATAKTVTSISLTAGDWDVFGQAGFTKAATTVIIYAVGSISLTDNTLGTEPRRVGIAYADAGVDVANDLMLGLPVTRISVAATTTVYLVHIAGFGTDTCSGFGRLSARRVR